MRMIIFIFYIFIINYLIIYLMNYIYLDSYKIKIMEKIIIYIIM